MESIWICVYRDTIKPHDENDNLAQVLVEEGFVKKYLAERINKHQKNKLSFDDFLNEYTADWTVDFYGYAMKHNAVKAIVF